MSKNKTPPAPEPEEEGPHVPTRDEIDAEVKALKALKPKIRQTSLFGDNHHDAIDTQIRVLEEDISEDDIYTQFQESDDEAAEDEVRGENILEAALAARRWLDGEEPNDDEKTLCDGWTSLIRPEHK